jgi:hypothetical protein
MNCPSGIEFDQDFHPSDVTHYYAQHELLYYVTHNPGFFSGDNLTTGSVIDLLPLSDAIKTDVKNRESIYNAPAIHLSRKIVDDVVLDHTIFRVSSLLLDATSAYMTAFSEYRGMELNNSQAESADDAPKATLQDVVFNWFSGISPHVSIGTHGPGGVPRPVINHQIKNQLHFDSSDATIEAALGISMDRVRMASAAPQKEVVVYILDTLPCKERIYDALVNYPNLAQDFEDILPPAGTPVANADRIDTAKAHYLYVSQTGTDFDELRTALADSEHYAVGDHDYDSSDHGLFIAGIVHLIAPKVKIYVIQVIDDSGVGTFDNYAAGLRTVMKLHRTENPNAIPVVNCSFAFSIPIDGHDKSRLDKNLQDFEGIHQGFKPQMDAFRMVLDDILAVGAKVFAASGNDSAGDGVDLSSHKPPRYPAQFEDVIGVGSIKWDSLNVNNRGIASYSNIADKPNCDGYYAYGGVFEDGRPLKQNQSDYIDSGKGIISIFTGNLAIDIGEHDHSQDTADGEPEEQTFENENGLAEWKGTSFATPVIAAYYARLISETGITPAEAIDKIDQNCDQLAGGPRKFKFGKQRHP